MRFQKQYKARTKKVFRIAIFLDDMAFDKKAIGSEILKRIFLNGRHSNFMVVVSLQYAMQVCNVCMPVQNVNNKKTNS